MRFSVVVPAYNREKELPKCIESVLNQTFQNFELIVVDNGSTDNTKDVVEKYIIKDERVKYFWQENSGSPAGSRNTGIEKALGEWIAFLDSDDYWYLSKLEEVNSIIDKSSHDIIAISHYEDKEINGVYHSTLEHGKVLSISAYEELLFQGNALSTSAMTVRKDKLFEVGLFDTRKGYFAVEDYDMWMKLAKVGLFAYIHKPLGVFSISDSNMSGNVELINSNLKFLVLNHIETLNIKNKALLKKIHGSRIDYYKGRSYQLNGEMKKAIPILINSIFVYPFSIKKYISLLFALFGIQR
ncbi:glycosyl transferase [Halarcobacter ebronensis]|uniref:Glycosyl transferase n=1 Tax=Halarcobacter ebronensis TaxID=1462615 RepID=A0A4Q0YEN7_9BACT|nr:glycosyltransferase family A protein [Halarcobacter ebronensis]RXJ69006.1 glycosyl transferase [Halarcobacter ebronensis]